MHHVLLAALMAFGPATALDQLRPVRELAAGLTSDDAGARARAAELGLGDKALFTGFINAMAAS